MANSTQLSPLDNLEDLETALAEPLGCSTPDSPGSQLGCMMYQNQMSDENVIGAVTVDTKIPVPTEKYPDFNFIGRLLGPRGMTVKQLEQETGCKILIRGQGSVKSPEREKRLRGRPGWEHLVEPLHVYIKTTEASIELAQEKMNGAMEKVRELLRPIHGGDQLKRRQLMELAIINGNYRPTIGRAQDLNRLCKPAFNQFLF